MAKDTQKVIEGTIGAFKALQQVVKEYKNDLAALQRANKQGSEEWKEAAEKLAKAQKDLDTVNKVAKGNLAAYNVEQVKTINDLKEVIKLKTQERNAMDMSSKEYKEATKELKVLNDQLREAGTSAGDWRSNVGAYSESLKTAFTDLSSAATGLSGGIGGLNTNLLKLASNPVGAVVAVLAGSVKFLSEGIKSSEENTNKWNEAMVPLQTAMTMIRRKAQESAEKFIEWVKGLRETEGAGNLLTKALYKIIEGIERTNVKIENIKSALRDARDAISNAFSKGKDMVDQFADRFPNLSSKLAEIGRGFKENIFNKAVDILGLNDKIKKSWLGRLLGMTTDEQEKEIEETARQKTDALVQEFKETEEEQEELTKTSNALAGTLRGLGHQAAQLTVDVEELNAAYAEALEEEDYEKAQELLDKRTEKQKALAQTQVSIAQAQLNVIQKQNAMAKSGTADLNAEAQAMDAVTLASAGMARADREAAQAQKRLNRAKQAKEDAAAAERLRLQVEALNIALNDYTQKYQTAVNVESPIAPEGADRTKDSLNAYYDQINENAQAEYDAYAEMTEKKIAKLEEWLALQREAGVEEKDLAKQVIDLEKLKAEQAAGYPQQYKKMIDTQNKSDRDRLKTLKSLQRSEIKGYADLFDSVSGLFEQNTVAYKATATAKALINTYLAATGAFADTPGGVVARSIAMAATLAAGLAQVIQIWKVNPKGETAVSQSSAPTPTIAEPTLVESQPFTYTREAQTFEEEDRLNQPLFVSVTDINNVQSRVKVVDDESSF